MPRLCIVQGCNNKVYAKLYCIYHQFKRKQFGGDLYQEKTDKLPMKLPKKQTRIPRRTKERATDEKYYAIQAREFFDNAVINGTNICVFCGKKVTNFEGLHHWRGRVGQMLLDSQWWSVVHNLCHAYKWHTMTLEQLQREEWYSSFLVRLKEKDIEAYNKLLARGEKTILFKDEE